MNLRKNMRLTFIYRQIPLSNMTFSCSTTTLWEHQKIVRDSLKEYGRATRLPPVDWCSIQVRKFFMNSDVWPERRRPTQVNMKSLLCSCAVNCTYIIPPNFLRSGLFSGLLRPVFLHFLLLLSTRKRRKRCKSRTDESVQHIFVKRDAFAQSSTLRYVTHFN